MELLFFIAVVIMGVVYFNMSNRLKTLEASMKELQQGRSNNASNSNPVQNASTPMYPEMTTAYTATSTPPVPVPNDQQNSYIPHVADMTNHTGDTGSSVIAWFKEDLLMKFGALFLLMAFGWFVSYAFIHEWIGEAGRITIGLVAGALIMALGAWRIKTHRHQGAIFTVLGSTIVILVVNAGVRLYGFFTEYSALGLMFFSVVFVAFVSLKYQRNGLAFASIVLAFLAPYFASTTIPTVNEFFLYASVIVLGTLWVVYRTGWRNLTLLSLIFVFLFATPYSVDENQKILALLWVFIFTALFFVANIISLIRQRGGTTSKTNLFTALGTALFLIVWVMGVAPQESQSLLLVAWTLVFSVGSYLVFRSTSLRSPFYVYAGTAIALFASATATELEGTVLAIAFTFEIAVLIFAAVTMNLGVGVLRALSALFVVPILLSFDSLASSAWRMGVIHGDFFNLLILTLVLVIVGLFVSERTRENIPGDVQTGGVLTTIGCIYALILLWLVMHALMDDLTATTVTLIMYTVIGIGTYYSGKVNGKDRISKGGAFLLGFVVCRLMLVDVWELELAGRIVTFLVIGVLLLGTAFISRTKKQDRNLQN